MAHMYVANKFTFYNINLNRRLALTQLPYKYVVWDTAMAS